MAILQNVGGGTPPFSDENPVQEQEDRPQLSILVGELDNNQDGKYVSVDEHGIQTDYLINNHYEQDRHTYMAGVTSPGGFLGAGAAFFRLALPTLLWVSDWTARRVGDKPKIARPESTSGRWVLLHAMATPAQLDLMGDGNSPVYRVTGTYVYGLILPNDNLWFDAEIPRPPHIQDVFPRLFSENDFRPNIIDVVGGAGGAFAGGPQKIV